MGVIEELELSVTVAVNVTDPPGDTDAGFGVTVSVVAWIAFIVRADVPAFVWCMPSPPYVAVIVTLSGELVAGVYDVVQVPDVSVQEDLPNTPPVLPSLQVTTPVGIFCEFDVSVTVAVTVTCPPDDMVDEDDVTKTDEVS